MAAIPILQRNLIAIAIVALALIIYTFMPKTQEEEVDNFIEEENQDNYSVKENEVKVNNAEQENKIHVDKEAKQSADKYRVVKQRNEPPLKNKQQQEDLGGNQESGVNIHEVKNANMKEQLKDYNLRGKLKKEANLPVNEEAPKQGKKIAKEVDQENPSKQRAELGDQKHVEIAAEKAGNGLGEISALFDEEDQKAEESIETYLKAREEGHSLEYIGSQIFNFTSKDKVKFLRGRPSMYPFLSTFTLQHFVDHNFSKDPSRAKANEEYLSRMKDGDVIFVDPNQWNMKAFLQDFVPHITRRFILLTHYADRAVPLTRDEGQLLEHDLLIRWFTRNPTKVHPKLVVMPTGVNGWYFSKRVDIDVFDAALRRRVPFYQPGRPTAKDDVDPKPILAYVNFNTAHNKVRAKVKDAFRGIGHVVEFGTSMEQWYQDIINSKFVVSPPGYGEDCFRHWESILLGAIPIVANSTIYPLFRGAPMLVLDDWNGVTEEQLLNYQVPNLGRKYMMAQYWFDRIDSFRNM